MSLEAGPAFEQVLEFLRQTRGFDFRGYRRQTLLRRVSKRAQQLDIGDFAEYLGYLQVHTDEYPILFNTILINVTEFFRDKPAWDYLAKEIIPSIVAKPANEPVRVWSAACASGEEAYSAAILICEAIGQDEFVRRVKIYATDVDDEALATARLGYSQEALATVPAGLVKKYFEVHSGRYVFKTSLRRALIFGRHDLLQDAPISRVDLLICRNALMYFTAESQGRILARLHYALNDGGYLFLGRAETLLRQSDRFMPVELKKRVFRKVARAEVPERLALIAQVGDHESLELAGPRAQLRVLAGEILPTAEIILDGEETLISANKAARTAFRLRPPDIGKPLKDLELSYRPVELQSRVAAAKREGAPVVVRGAEHRVGDGPPIIFDVQVTPLMLDRAGVIGISITFQDVTEQRRLQSELERVRQEVETANEELQSSYEKLETTNEELQSTVEVLETTNEELQSSNEELETMNEELKSTNSQQQAINIDLRRRTEEVNTLNTFLDAILASLQVGVAVLDHDLTVMLWNARAGDLWGVRQDEAVGKRFSSLDIGLPLDRLESLVTGAAQGMDRPTTHTLRAINRRGRTIDCRISLTPLSAVSPTGKGVVVVMEELAPQD